MSTDRDDGIDFDAHDSPANHSRVSGIYLPIDPTIPRPHQYDDLSKDDFLLVCEYWRFAALHWLRREKPDEFHQRFGSLVGRRDPASRYMRTLITAGEVDSASSSYFFPECQFAELTEIIVRACGDCGIDSQPIHEFLRYADADLKDAIRAVERLERRLRRELAQESKPPAEDERPSPDVSQSEEPAKDPLGAGDGGSTSTAPSSADKRPDDLITLKVAKKRYRASESTLYRAIKTGKLKSWRNTGTLKHKVSEAAVKNIYVAWGAT